MARDLRKVRIWMGQVAGVLAGVTLVACISAGESPSNDQTVTGIEETYSMNQDPAPCDLFVKLLSEIDDEFDSERLSDHQQAVDDWSASWGEVTELQSDIIMNLVNLLYRDIEKVQERLWQAPGRPAAKDPFEQLSHAQESLRVELGTLKMMEGEPRFSVCAEKLRRRAGGYISSLGTYQERLEQDVAEGRRTLDLREQSQLSSALELAAEARAYLK